MLHLAGETPQGPEQMNTPAGPESSDGAQGRRNTFIECTSTMLRFLQATQKNGVPPKTVKAWISATTNRAEQWQQRDDSLATEQKTIVQKALQAVGNVGEKKPPVEPPPPQPEPPPAPDAKPKPKPKPKPVPDSAPAPEQREAPETVFAQQYRTLHRATTEAKQKLAGATKRGDVISNLQAIIGALNAEQTHLQSATEKQDIDLASVELPRVKREIADYTKAIEQQKGERDQDVNRLLQEDLNTAYQHINGSLNIRLAGARANAESAQREIDAFNVVERRIARMSGVLAGMEETVERNKGLITRYESLQAALNAANANPDLSVRRTQFERINAALVGTRIDFRDANAALARGSDRLMGYDVTTPTPERAPFANGIEVYAMVDEHTVERGWRITAVNGETLTLSKNGATMDRPVAQVWHIGEIEGGRTFNSNIPRNVVAEMLNRQYTMLSRYSRLNDADYHRLFDGPLQQQNVGNCYLIASLEALRSMPPPRAEIILRTGVRISERGNGYDVRIPLANADGEWISVSREELGVIKGLNPVQAAEGYQAIEAAYCIKKFGRPLNRRSMTGGLGDEALHVLLSSGVRRNTLESPDVRKPFSSNAEKRAEVEAWLNGFSRERFIATVNTPRRGSDTHTFTIGGNTFHYTHAYALLNVNTEGRTVTVANPHDTSRPITITYDQFMNTFSDLSFVTLDYRRMFNTA